MVLLLSSQLSSHAFSTIYLSFTSTWSFEFFIRPFSGHSKLPHNLCCAVLCIGLWLWKANIEGDVLPVLVGRLILFYSNRRDCCLPSVEMPRTNSTRTHAHTQARWRVNNNFYIYSQNIQFMHTYIDGHVYGIYRLESFILFSVWHFFSSFELFMAVPWDVERLAFAVHIMRCMWKSIA